MPMHRSALSVLALSTLASSQFVFVGVAQRVSPQAGSAPQTNSLAVRVAAPAGTPSTQPVANSVCSGMGLGNNGPLNGFVPSTADAWHQDISGAAVDASSTKILTTSGDLAGSYLHPDFGPQAGIPYVVVDSRTQASVPVAINLYAGDSDITLAPVPANAPVEDSPAACAAPIGDQHLLVLDRAECVAYEYWLSSSCKGAWSAANTALWDMTEAEKRPYTLTSADASGLSVFEGLIRYDEIIAGSINHAIRFTAAHTKTGAKGGYFVAPATHAAGNSTTTDNIIGMRIRLKANVDISKFSGNNRIILTAMKKYGMILADNGSNLFFQGTLDNRWDNNDLNALKAIPASDFEVVQMGAVSTMDQPPTGAAPAITSFKASATTVAAGTAVTLTAATTGASYSYIDKAGFLRGTSMTVTPAATTTYTLTSRNAYGTVSKSVTVTVR